MLKPADFVANYSKTGAVKSTAPTARLLLLGIAAGFILACAGAAASNAAFSIPLASVAKLVSALIFPFGLIAIIYTGSELFTGNCLISISLLDGSAKLSGMVRNLVIVYIGNIIGGAGLGALLWYCHGKSVLNK